MAVPVQHLMIGRGNTPRSIRVGPLVAYSGSAMTGIAARLSEHRAVLKPRYYHVNPILAAAGLEFEVERPGRPRADECLMAKALAKLPGAEVVRGAGNSDCAKNGRPWCVGHVVNLPLDQAARARALAGGKHTRSRR